MKRFEDFSVVLSYFVRTFPLRTAFRTNTLIVKFKIKQFWVKVTELRWLRIRSFAAKFLVLTLLWAKIVKLYCPYYDLISTTAFI